MAAMLKPGMRAISITISADSGAGGFILPNDRVDLILTRKGDANRVSASTILTDVRVLAVDQTFKQEKDTKTVIGKTATLEVTPARPSWSPRRRARASLSLSLRPLTSSDTPVASNAPARRTSRRSGRATTKAAIRFPSSATASPATRPLSCREESPSEDFHEGFRASLATAAAAGRRVAPAGAVDASADADMPGHAQR